MISPISFQLRSPPHHTISSSPQHFSLPPLRLSLPRHPSLPLPCVSPLPAATPSLPLPLRLSHPRYPSPFPFFCASPIPPPSLLPPSLLPSPSPPPPFPFPFPCHPPRRPLPSSSPPPPPFPLPYASPFPTAPSFHLRCHPSLPPSCVSPRPLSFPFRCASTILDHALMLHHVVIKIDKIKTRINEIFDNKKRYDIEGGKRGNKQEAEWIQKQMMFDRYMVVVGDVWQNQVCNEVKEV